MSALAARRLHSQDAAALKTPETKRKSPKISTSRSRSPVTATSSESESAEDIVAKRREIERKLREQVKVQARARQTLQYGNTSLEESALARVRRRKSGEAGDLAPVMDEEMVDVNEVVELGSGDEAIGVEDEAAESPVDLGNGEVMLVSPVRGGSIMNTSLELWPYDRGGACLYGIPSIRETWGLKIANSLDIGINIAQGQSSCKFRLSSLLKATIHKIQIIPPPFAWSLERLVIPNSHTSSNKSLIL